MRNGTDQGPEFAYWKLSYRRKFLRTLWVTPIIFLPFVLPEGYVAGVPRDAFLWIFLALFLVQAAYTYKKWKEEDRSPPGQHSGDEHRDTSST